MKWLVQANPNNNYIYTFQLVSKENWEMNKVMKRYWNSLGTENL